MLALTIKGMLDRVNEWLVTAVAGIGRKVTPVVGTLILIASLVATHYMHAYPLLYVVQDILQGILCIGIGVTVAEADMAINDAKTTE